MVALARPHPRAEVRVVAGATLVRSKRQAKRSCASMPSVLRGYRPIFRQNLPVAGASLSLSVVASRGVACLGARLGSVRCLLIVLELAKWNRATPCRAQPRRNAVPRHAHAHGTGGAGRHSGRFIRPCRSSAPPLLVSLSLSLVDMAYRTWPLVPAAARDGRSDSDADPMRGREPSRGPVRGSGAGDRDMDIIYSHVTRTPLDTCARARLAQHA